MDPIWQNTGVVSTVTGGTKTRGEDKVGVGLEPELVTVRISGTTESYNEVTFRVASGADVPQVGELVVLTLRRKADKPVDPDPPKVGREVD